MKNKKVLSVGTMYLDVNCINFPFDQALFANRETVGGAYHIELGGSALNFAKIAAQLGMDISFLGKTGEDEIGTLLVTLLKQGKIKPLVIFDKNVQTNLAVHYVHSDGSSIMTSCGDANQSLTINDIEDNLEATLDSIAYLYLGGVFKLKNILPDLKQIAKEAQKRGVVVALDHGRVNNSVTSTELGYMRELIAYIDIYLPSIDEFLAVWESDTLQEGFAKINKISKPLTVVKQAADGAVGFYNDQITYTHPYEVTVINTVGAGDSFNAGFLKAHMDRKSIKDCMQFACAVAATKISSAKSVTLDKVRQLISKYK
jgi:sugar/nucleoside kinase (ribokinase family)